MILVVNAGSSSIKFKLFNIKDTKNPEAIVEGLAERISVDGALTIEVNGEKHKSNPSMPSHEEAVQAILDQFTALNVIEKPEDIKGIGFRVVHGGTKVTQSSKVDENLKEIIKENIKLAPLHNPGALTAINAFENHLPSAKLVACFDTSYHQTMAEDKFLYAVPYKWYKDYGVRRYGMHGISYDFISKRFADIKGTSRDKVNLIVCHLGNGASMAAIENGKCVDTTMGLTPLAGLVMGTRSGDVDPSVLQYMAKELNKDVFEITDMLNKESGLLGLSEISSDMRDVRDEFKKGNKQAIVAISVYAQRIADYIVNYANKLNGNVDAIVFTAGVGENSAEIRQEIVNRVNILGVKMNEEANSSKYGEYNVISADDSKIPMYAMRTNEELMICLETIRLNNF